MKKIYEFNRDCGRMGSLDGIFVATHDEVGKIVGEEIYFGEVLGKHSDICITLREIDLRVLSDDREFVAQFIEVIGEGTISGFNPLDYYDEEDEYNAWQIETK